MTRRRWSFGSFLWAILALIAAASVAFIGLSRSVEYFDRYQVDHITGAALALATTVTPLLIIALLLFGYHRAVRWLMAAAAIVWAGFNIGGIGVPAPGGNAYALQRWLLVGLIAIVVLHRLRQARTVGSSPANVAMTDNRPAAGFGTGLLVVGSDAAAAAVPHYVSDWGRRHPEDASLAVAQVDTTGLVDTTLYAIADGQALWAGTIGRVANHRSLTDAAPQIATLLADALGVPPMIPEVAA